MLITIVPDTPVARGRAAAIPFASGIVLGSSADKGLAGENAGAFGDPIRMSPIPVLLYADNLWIISEVVGRVATLPMTPGGSPPLQSVGQNQKWPTSGPGGYITTAA